MVKQYFFPVKTYFASVQRTSLVVLFRKKSFFLPPEWILTLCLAPARCKLQKTCNVGACA